MPFIVDTTKFQAEGAFLHWKAVARRLHFFNASVAVPELSSVLQLRWTLKADLGLPTEPFIVWRRESKLREPKSIDVKISPPNLFSFAQLIDLRSSYSTIDLLVSGSGGVIYGFVGSPMVSSIVAIASVSSGSNVPVTLSAPAIEGLVLSLGITISSIRGVSTDSLSLASGWKKFEVVGLPVKQLQWADQGIGRHGTEQGMVSALTDSFSAAKQRLARGAPPIGWGPIIAPGVPAPLWSAPSPDLLIEELNTFVLDDLRSIAGLPPSMHAAQKVSKPLPPPENSSGEQMSDPGGTSQIAPLYSAYMAAAVDCFNCLALGFGTAYSSAVNQSDPLDFDYMITARYEKGIDGVTGPAEFAAVVPIPTLAIAPPIPASMSAQIMGYLRPLRRDGSWRTSVRVSWDRVIPTPLFRPRSFAFARSDLAPVSAASLLLKKRLDGSPLAVAVNYHATLEEPEPNRLSAIDREIPIPNAPGSRGLKYAAAHQDIYGQWSNWVPVNITATQPGVDEPRIVSAEFKYTLNPAPPNPRCYANLCLEFLWDWRIRTPQTISFRGRLHSAAYHGAPPPVVTLPAGLQVQLSAPPAITFTLHFDVLASNGAPTSGWPGYDPVKHCIALNSAGDQEVEFGSAQGSDTRRYRVIIPGFELDFGLTGHIGLALWGQGQEGIPPQNHGNWSTSPSVISTSDPRPPIIVPDIVTLSSLPDAAGESHAIVKWANSPGAAGYFIYESSEMRLRQFLGESEPDPALTLSERLTHVRALFDAQPLSLRRQFIRRNARLIKGTSSDITLPRGSTAIHLFIVLGVSAGQVEAAWPTDSTALFAFTVPRVPKPAPPTVEASAILDTTVTPNLYRARLHIETRPGPRVQRIDVHRVRVDDAAKELDTMGPPVVTVDSLTPGWQVPAIDPRGFHIPAATGIDTPSGSWKRVWYRVAAWSADDPLRGTLAARSPASTTAWVVIPPPLPPELSFITAEWPGLGPADVLLKWTSLAPVAKTPLGSHLLTVRAKRVGAPLEEPPLLAFDGPLSSLAITQPATGSDVWRVEGSRPFDYRALLRRADVNDAVKVTVRLTDPLGRSNERFADIKPGPFLPDPQLADFMLRKSSFPLGSLLHFTSTTPLDPAVYTLRVTVHLPPGPLGQFPPLLPSQPTIVQEGLLASVLLEKPGVIPSGTDQVIVRRIRGAGPLFTYYVFVRILFTRIVVRLSALDGRVVEHTELSQ